MSKQLFIMRQPPHSTSLCQEMLDIILTMAAFDQKISLLFLDLGVFQLKSQQNPEHLAMKDTSAIFKALAIYEVDQLYAEVESMQRYGLKPSDLILPVREIYRKDVSQLMHQHSVFF